MLTKKDKVGSEDITKHMVIGNKRRDTIQTVFVVDKEFATVENLVYLGVNVDKKLTFKKCVNGTISRVNDRLINLARIRSIIDATTCLAIYKQTIHPILDYMSILVNSCATSKVTKLQPLQNRAIRIVEKRYGYVNTAEMNELHTKLNLKMLCDR